MMGEPNRVNGSILQSIYSSEVDDFVATRFVYENNCYGTIVANWADPSYRKPANTLELIGTKGKILADKHMLKIFLNAEDPNNSLKSGWTTFYITELANGVRFYVRGNEFTRQLDYFVNCIEKGQTQNVSGFSEAIKTDTVINMIFDDANRSDNAEAAFVTNKSTLKSASTKIGLLEKIQRWWRCKND